MDLRLAFEEPSLLGAHITKMDDGSVNAMLEMYCQPQRGIFTGKKALW